MVTPPPLTNSAYATAYTCINNVFLNTWIFLIFYLWSILLQSLNQVTRQCRHRFSIELGIFSNFELVS